MAYSVPAPDVKLPRLTPTSTPLEAVVGLILTPLTVSVLSMGEGMVRSMALLVLVVALVATTKLRDKRSIPSVVMPHPALLTCSISAIGAAVARIRALVPVALVKLRL